jgi:hypothetical protein
MLGSLFVEECVATPTADQRPLSLVQWRWQKYAARFAYPAWIILVVWHLFRVMLRSALTNWGG